MGFFSKLFGKSNSSAQETGWRVGGTEDFMTLIRVYYQAVMASSFGLRDLRALTDLRIFKQTLKVPTINNRVGLGEKKQCQKMLGEIYGISDEFFKEIDSSIKRRCKNIQDMQTYLIQFQGFTQELMMLMGNILSWKFRLPSFLKGTIRNLTQKAIRDVFAKDNWSDDSVRQSVMKVRAYQQQLGYSESWMTEFVYNVIILAKKEPKGDATAND